MKDDWTPPPDQSCKCGAVPITLLDKYTAVCAKCAPLTALDSWPAWANTMTYLRAYLQYDWHAATAGPYRHEDLAAAQPVCGIAGRWVDAINTTDHPDAAPFTLCADCHVALTIKAAA